MDRMIDEERALLHKADEAYEDEQRKYQSYEQQLLERIRELEAKLDLALSKWRSIETAPKDGRPFITFSPDRDDDWELMYDIAGWDTEGECWWKINCGFNYATHWMPLPEPPDSDVEEALADD